MNEISATIVFEKNWAAIHATNPDGSRKYRYLINEGSSRSSKTRSLITITYLYAHQNKQKRISVWRDTKKDCRDTVGHDVKQVFPTLPFNNIVQYNKTEAVYQFPSGSVFEINGTDEPNKLHGYNCNVAWFNEPYNIGIDTFNQLDMRTSDFILIDWNPQKAHWIDDLKKDPRTLVIKSTFRDNPFCPPEQKIKILSYQPVKKCQIVLDKILQEGDAKAYDIETNPLSIPEKLLKELSRCKENERKGSANPFNWSVYGLGEHAEKPNRIFFWTEVSDDDYHKIDAPRYYGVDWGTVDPWGILECKYYDGALYFHEKNYASENEIKENMTMHELEQVNKIDEGIVKFLFNKLDIPKSSYVICDTNRPLKILALHAIGYDYAIAAPKPPGSIIDGITMLTDLKVYFTASSKNIKYEQENYERQVDRYGIVLDEPVDKDNHCFSGDTLIKTIDGDRRIDTIEKGQYVLTSKGFRKVLKKWNNGKKQTFNYLMQFDMFSLNLCCTADHKIKTENGWIEISKLESGMIVSLIKPLTAKNTFSSQVKDILKVQSSVCIGRYGNFITGRDLKDITYTIRTTILGIIKSVTLNSKRQERTNLSTQKKDLKKTQNGLRPFMLKALKWLSSGTQVLKELNGIKSKVLKHGKTESIEQNNASIAEKNIKQEQAGNLNSVIITARLLHLEKGEENQQVVYDLMVDDAHEYLANGVLVHNCMDPSRYIVLFLIMMGIIKQ